MAKKHDMIRETSEDRTNETGGSERSNDSRKMSVRIGEATTIRLPSDSGANNPGFPGPMSLVVAGTVMRDQFGGQSEERSMRDNDRPVLHAELRLDGCIKPDGKLCPLKSLKILVQDDEGISQPRSPGSPQRTISVTMSDGSKISDAEKQSPGRSVGGEMQYQNEDGRDADTGMQQLVYHSPNIILEEPFNVYRYQTRMLGDQPQGLAAALTKDRPELLPPFKAPQGLATVMLFDSSADEFYPEHETTERRNNTSSENRKHEFRSAGEGESISYDQEYQMRIGSQEQTEMSSENLQSGGEDSSLRHWSGKSENLHILQSLPQEVVSSLVSGHSKRLSEDSGRGGRGSPTKYLHEGSQRSKDRSINFEDEHHHHKRHSRNTEGTPQHSGSSTYTSYFSSNSRANGSSRHEVRASQRSSQKFLDGGNEQPKGGYDGRSSPRRSKRHSKDLHSSPGSSYASYFTNSNSRGSGSFQHEGRGRQRSSRKLLEGVNEEHEVSYDNQTPQPPPPPHSGEYEDRKDQRRKTLKGSQREPGCSVSFRSSDVSVDDTYRPSYGSAYQTKSQTGSFLDPTPSERTRDSTGMASSQHLHSEDRMASISKLLDNMSSITQLLSNIPQQVGGKEPWMQRTSQDMQGASHMNRLGQQYFSNEGTWQFDEVNKGPSQLLIAGEDAPQTNQMPYNGSQQSQFLVGGPSQPSSSNNLPLQDHQLNSRPSQMHSMNSQESQLQTNRPSQLNMQGSDSQQFQNMDNRSSKFTNDKSSKMNLPDTSLHPFDLLNNGPSQVLKGTMNRSSQLNVQDDGSPQVDNTIRQPSQILTNRLSQQNLPGNNSQQIFPMENRPSQSLNNRPSQLNIPNDGSQLYPNRPSQLNMQEGNQQLPTMDNRASHMLDSRPSQLAMKTQDCGFPQLHIRNRQSSHMLTNRLSQQQNLQGDSFQHFLPLGSRPSHILNGRPSQTQGTGVQQAGPTNKHSSQFLNTPSSQMEMQMAGSRILSSLIVRPSQLITQGTNTQGEEPQQFQSMDKRPSQLVNTRPSQVGSNNNRLSQLNTQGSDVQDMQQFDPMNSRPSRLLNTRPSRNNIQGEESQQFDTMNNRPSQPLKTMLSQAILRSDDFHQFDPMNSRPSQLLNARASQSGMLDDSLQQFDTLNPRPSQLLDNRPSQINMRPSQLLNTRPSQIGMQDDDFQQFDPMNPRPSQLLDTRQSQINMRPSELLNVSPLQVNMQDDGLQQFDPMNVQPSQFLNTRPSQTDMLYEDPQQFDSMNSRPTQLADTRPSQFPALPSQDMSPRPSQFDVQDDALQQFDQMNPRKSQLVNSRPSQFTMQDEQTQEFDPMNPRQSQLMKTRPSKIGMQDDDIQQFDNMEPRPSYLLGSRQSQMMNLRSSQLLSTRLSQLNMEDGGLQPFDPMNPRPSQLLNTRPSQMDMQDDGLEPFDSMNPRPFDPMNPRPSQLLNTRPQMDRQDDGLEQFDSMNPRPSQYANIRSSQMNLQENNVQQFDTMDVRPSQLLNNNRQSQQIMQDDGPQQSQTRPSQLMLNRPSQAMNRGPSQFDIPNRPSQLANYWPSQLSSGRHSQIPNQGPINTPRASVRQTSLSMALCDNCSDPSHDARNCPIQVCFQCREPGHYARNCIKPVTGQGTSDPAMLQQGGKTQKWDGVMESENAAQIGGSPQVLETLGTVDDSQNLQTRELGEPVDGNMEFEGSSEYSQSSEK